MKYPEIGPDNNYVLATFDLTAEQERAIVDTCMIAVFAAKALGIRYTMRAERVASWLARTAPK